MRIFIYTILLLYVANVYGQEQTPFERSNGRQTATYFECIDFYKRLDRVSPQLSIKVMGMSDAGYPYHLLLVFQ